MFKSVGLNIDNPETFFVRQGRITKIVNFKPSDLREMLEEAAGISYYKEVSAGCIRIMDRKGREHRHQEERMLENLGPKLTMLERQQKLEDQYRKLLEEQEQAQLVIDQITYIQAFMILGLDETGAPDMHMTIDTDNSPNQHPLVKNLLERKRELKSHLKNIEQEIEEFKTSLDEATKLRLEKKKHDGNQGEEDPEIAKWEDEKKKLEKKVNEVQKNLDKFELKLKTSNDLVSGADEDLKKEQNKKEQLQNENELLIKKLETLKQDEKIFDRKLKMKRNELTELKVSSNPNDLKQLVFQRAQTYKMELKTNQTKAKKLMIEIEKKEKKLQKLQDYINDDEEQKQKLTEQFSEILAQMKKYEGAEQKMRKQKTKFIKEIQSLKDQLSAKTNKIDAFKQSKNIEIDKFEFRGMKPIPPGLNINRSDILGYVYTHFRVHKKFRKAIEKQLEGRLYSVITKSFQVTKSIIEKKLLYRNTRFISLDNITPRVINQIKIDMAKKVAEKAKSRIWVPFKDEEVLTMLSNGMEAVRQDIFGNFFICENLSVAKSIAYNNNIQVNCVTLEGDKVYSSGMMSGGHNKVTNTPFQMWNNFQEIREDTMIQKKLKSQVDQLQEENSNNLRDLSNEVERYKELRHQSVHLENRINEISGASRQTKIDGLQRSITSDKEILKTLTKTIDKTIKDIEKNDQDIKKAEMGSMKDADIRKETARVEKEIDSLQKKLEVSRTEFQTMENQRDNFEEELEKCDRKIDSCAEKLDKRKNEAAKLEDNLDQLKEQNEELEQKKLDVQANIDKKEEANRQIYEKIYQLNHKTEEIKNELNNHELKIERQKKEILNAQSNLQQVNQKLSLQEKEHVQQNRDMFINMNLNDYVLKLQQIEQELTKIKPKVTLNNQNKNDDIKEKMVTLQEKKNKIKENENAMKKDIGTMNEISESEYVKCFYQVNKDLGLLFSKLLPGTTAKMVPVYHKKANKENNNNLSTEINIMLKDKFHGITIQVSFDGGKTYKQSLTELSGGQRSLLALSFMLAMLKYRSAPFYILDEIDAAMDLSHTEGVGRLIGSEFEGSQFLVISLKKGMFSAANVLFRTNLNEGKSEVMRIDQTGGVVKA